eukprot:TRINITY_DN1972_c0_g1_i10.p3 TRINITY_DN1972_c0_g1~~TRINITY_DN1972_c0_g1_i10.p3  ORF type:complete len:101 (+),score=12.14 TRINITY_DN1972_c0_g1_i10:383-685(+)
MQVERSLRGEWRKGEEQNRTYPKVGDSFWKRKVIPHVLYGGKVYRLGSGDSPIRQLVRQRLTKPKTGSGCESMTRRIGTETLPGLLREAAVTNLPQWAKA